MGLLVRPPERIKWQATRNRTMVCLCIHLSCLALHSGGWRPCLVSWMICLRQAAFNPVVCRSLRSFGTAAGLTTGLVREQRLHRHRATVCCCSTISTEDCQYTRVWFDTVSVLCDIALVTDCTSATILSSSIRAALCCSTCLTYCCIKLIAAFPFFMVSA